MELPTFTFFLLAFVALTDGAPRDLMDDSIDMIKPEQAKADLARARLRRVPGGWEPLDPESEEAKKEAKLALDWLNEREATRSGNIYYFPEEKAIRKAEKQIVAGFNYRLELWLESYGNRPGTCHFEILEPLEGAPEIHSEDCFPEKLAN